MKSRHTKTVEVIHSAPIPIPQPENTPNLDNSFSFYVGSPRSERRSFLHHGFPPDKSKECENLITRCEFERRRDLIEKHLFWTASKSSDPLAAAPAQEPVPPAERDEAESEKPIVLRNRM